MAPNDPENASVSKTDLGQDLSDEKDERIFESGPAEQSASEQQFSQDASPQDVTPGNATGEARAGGEESKPTRSRAKVALIMLSLCTAVFLAALDVTIITTALPTISEHFHSSLGFTWIGSGFLLANSASVPLWGKVSDIWGRKPILLLANFVFFVGSLLCGVSVNIGMLIAARAIQGVGAGGLIVLSNIAISDLFSQRSRGAYYGLIGMTWAIASALGPVIGGAFTEGVSWRWCFYINLPLDGIAFVLMVLFLDVHTPRTPIRAGLRAIDWIGAISIVGGSLMFLLGLEYGGVTFPWDSATVVSLLVVGVAVLIFFFFNEWRLTSHPIMPTRIFSHRSNLAILFVCLMHGVVFISASYFLPLYFQAILGASPLLSGVYLLPLVLSLSFASATVGIFIRKTGMYREAIWFGMTIMTIGFGLFVDLAADSSWAKIILYQIVAGLGVGPNFQSPLIALQAQVHGRDAAAATSTFGFIRQLATAIGVVIGSVVFQNAMLDRQNTLRESLGPQLAQQLEGINAGANVEVIKGLPSDEKSAVRDVFADSLSKMWILFVVLAGVGLLTSMLIQKKKLSREHTEVKTGLAEEEERRRVLEEERRKKSRGTQDVESKGN
ncbi:MFS multidrug transporter-like protein [Lineolata rhizophorae]|uniref:Efflux pump dotC n=1 Tax=Lineolata rhizophorae TaxID=578093 RepID=A0A6A6P7X4_9PEZI|nr:MFS multidrug transporter-like protein [Lineolata rhizophorae]